MKFSTQVFPSLVRSIGIYIVISENIKFENGDLVLEATCHNPVTRSEVGAACDNFNHMPLSIPPVGSHVTVTGTYVLDTRKNNWD
jgi:hypothetical protein